MIWLRRKICLKLWPLKNEERKEEVKIAQERADQTASEEDDLNDSVLVATMRTIYRGQGVGDLLITDATNILPRYLSDANVADEFTEMAIFGYLEPGVEIEVEYQIIPGGQDYVQGIRLSVIEVPPVEIPTPAIVIDESADADVASQPEIQIAPPESCTVSPDAGWVTYRIKEGDSLGAIAASRAVALSEVANRNCIANLNVVVWGSEIFVPPSSVVNADPTATNTATRVPPKATSVTLPATAPSSTQVSTQAPTEVPTGSATDAPTDLPTSETDEPVTDVPTDTPVTVEVTTILTLTVTNEVVTTPAVTGTILVTSTATDSGGPDTKG